MLVIEDLQWADRSTRDFLAFMARGARREPLALIVSFRSDELRGRGHPARQFVHELERSGRATRVELGPFTRAELREQITAILGTTPDSYPNGSDALDQAGRVDECLERRETGRRDAALALTGNVRIFELPEYICARRLRRRSYRQRVWPGLDG